MTQSFQDRQTLTAFLLQAGRLWRRLAEHQLAPYGISEARGGVLLTIARLGGGVRQVTLAANIGIEGTSLVRLLDELGRARLIERRDDPQDRRAKTIWLTAEGERLAGLVEQELSVLRRRVLRDLPAEDIQATLRVFLAIRRAADSEGTEGSR